MFPKKKFTLVVLLASLALIALACSLPSLARSTPPPSPPPLLPPPATATTLLAADTPPTTIPPTNTPEITHILFPASSAGDTGKIVYDVFSRDTAPEKRAPYGDSYDINRLERPFKQDMSYVADMDIVTFNLSEDGDWYYISIELIGKDPNNSLGINYGVEIDNDADGFGDTIIWANPPYTDEWSNENLQVFEDKNHDTAGLSADLSDAPLNTTDGYESLLFDRGIADDPDLAWVRKNAGLKATLQFAFKKSLTDGTFMLGVLADAGLKDVTKMNYNDRFTAEEAGSSVRSNRYYPLGELYLFDNTCREAYGFSPTGYEPQLCPPPTSPTKEPGQPAQQTVCTNPSQYTDEGSCTAAGCSWALDPAIVAAMVFHCVAP